jgi:large subunit ribosomal protein L4
MTLEKKTKRTVKLFNVAGQVIAELDVKSSVARAKANDQLLHDYVVQLQNSQRSWTASTKTRAEVKATGAKPWRQKGTGRARAGSLASPLFRGGGVVFGPKPKVVENRFPKRMKKLVFEHALGEKIRQDRLLVLDELHFETPKTKVMAQTLKSLNTSGKVLLIAEKTDRKALLSARNIPQLTFRNAGDVSAFDILRHKFVVLTKACFESLGLAEQ